MRVVVVGASSGIGRCIGVGLGQRGAQVALLARRHDMLVDAASDAGSGSLAIACDVTDEASCRHAIHEAAHGLGGIDGLVYATAVGYLGALVDTDALTWQRTLATNVVGAAVATSAALPYLTDSRGVAVYLSSWSASITPPWPGLGAYVASKAALEKMVDAYRVEYPAVGFTRLTLGNCGGGKGDAASQFAAGWAPDVAGEYVNQWASNGYVTASLIDVDEVIRAVDGVLHAGASASIPSVVLLHRD